MTIATLFSHPNISTTKQCSYRENLTLPQTQHSWKPVSKPNTPPRDKQLTYISLPQLKCLPASSMRAAILLDKAGEQLADVPGSSAAASTSPNLLSLQALTTQSAGFSLIIPRTPERVYPVP